MYLFCIQKCIETELCHDLTNLVWFKTQKSINLMIGKDNFYKENLLYEVVWS